MFSTVRLYVPASFRLAAAIEIDVEVTFKEYGSLFLVQEKLDTGGLASTVNERKNEDPTSTCWSELFNPEISGGSKNSDKMKSSIGADKIIIIVYKTKTCSHHLL